jgi:putative hydrolase of the HAD superfamily
MDHQIDLRAVIFDYGKVLSLSADGDAHRELVATTGLPLEIFEQHYWANRDAYDVGTLGGRTYWEKIARDSGVRFSEEQLTHLVVTDTRMWLNVNEPMLAWAGQLRTAGFRIAILSNLGDALVEHMVTKVDWVKRFHHATWSSKLNIVKPNPVIYLHTVERLGVEPQEALFIDDKPENIHAAEALGIHGICFTDIAALVEQLKARGLDKVLPLPELAVVEEA